MRTAISPLYGLALVCVCQLVLYLFATRRRLIGRAGGGDMVNPAKGLSMIFYNGHKVGLSLRMRISLMNTQRDGE